MLFYLYEHKKLNMRQTTLQEFFKVKKYHSKNTKNNMRQTKIQDFFKPFGIVKKVKKCYGYNSETEEWHCIECGVSMGRGNPRQLCGKWRCYS